MPKNFFADVSTHIFSKYFQTTTLPCSGDKCIFCEQSVVHELDAEDLIGLAGESH